MTVEQIAQLIAAVVTIATIITAVTPTRADNAALDIMLRVLNTMAGNVGKNRNKDG